MARNSFPFILLSLLLILFFHDVAFLGKTLSTSSLLPGTTPHGPYGFSGHRPALPPSFDIAGNAWVNEPNPYIIKNANGTALPAWNPREGLGMPLTGNLNTEVFNPLKLFLNIFPGPFSQDLFFLLRLLVMGAFTYLFLREMKLSLAASLLGSSSFMLSGYSVWWINLHPLSTVMYLPAVFYFYERWGNRKDLKSPFLMSLSLAFALVSGKIPDVIMGLSLLFLYAIWKGIVTPPPNPPLKLRGGWGSYDGGGLIIRSIFREVGKVILVTVSGAMMAGIALVPFVELYSHASPLARAIRTGAAGHSIPLITSVSLIQPLFLGWENYFYGSWLRWSPDAILPHAGIVVAIFFIYSTLHRGILKKTVPFLLFSLFIFFMVYGIFPSRFVAGLPVFESIEFLKYNVMLYFCLAVMSAHAFDDLLSEKAGGKRFVISITAVWMIILAYFLFLQRAGHGQMRGYMLTVLLLSLAAVSIMGLSFYISRSRRVFGMVIFGFLILELFLYMPKNHPDRYDPYARPPYLDVIREKMPYRFIGDGSSIPPLVSNAAGLYDIRGINVLLPGDYYLFFENLLSFSVPQTNNPSPLFSATSPFIDLIGAKYIMSGKALEYQNLENEVRSQISSLRWIRFFDAMVSHKIRGGASYGFFNAGGEGRFSFFFPLRFRFETKLRISEPFLFAGFALKGAPKDAEAVVKVIVDNKAGEVVIKGEGWQDRWIDVSAYIGKVIVIAIEGNGSGNGKIALGNFGLSPGHDKETVSYGTLLTLHKRELNFLKYKGEYEGLHIYENSNVMERAFVLHNVKPAGGLGDVIRKLQEGSDFREVALVTGSISGSPEGRNPGEFSALPEKTGEDRVTIRKYASDEVALEVESKGGLLVLSDLYYPGWKVRVNGREERIIKAFGLLKGVLIGNGRSEVIFSYRPLSLYLGIAISLTTFIAWILISYYGSRRKPLH